MGSKIMTGSNPIALICHCLYVYQILHTYIDINEIVTHTMYILIYADLPRLMMINPTVPNHDIQSYVSYKVCLAGIGPVH